MSQNCQLVGYDCAPREGACRARGGRQERAFGGPHELRAADLGAARWRASAPVARSQCTQRTHRALAHRLSGYKDAECTIVWMGEICKFGKETLLGQNWRSGDIRGRGFLPQINGDAIARYALSGCAWKGVWMRQTE